MSTQVQTRSTAHCEVMMMSSEGMTVTFMLLIIGNRVSQKTTWKLKNIKQSTRFINVKLKALCIRLKPMLQSGELKFGELTIDRNNEQGNVLTIVLSDKNPQGIMQKILAIIQEELNE